MLTYTYIHGTLDDMLVNGDEVNGLSCSSSIMLEQKLKAGRLCKRVNTMLQWMVLKAGAMQKNIKNDT